MERKSAMDVKSNKCYDSPDRKPLPVDVLVSGRIDYERPLARFVRAELVKRVDGTVRISTIRPGAKVHRPRAK